LDWDELYPYPRLYPDDSDTDEWDEENLVEIPPALYERWLAMDKEREAVCVELKRIADSASSAQPEKP
jgi:hypothetical protein